MTAPNSSTNPGWVAILSAVATVAMLVTAILTSRLNLGNTFRVLVIALMALIILVALTLHLRLRSLAPTLSLAAMAMAILGAVLTAVAHVLQMAGGLSDVQFNTVGEAIGPAAIGVWLLLANYVAVQRRALPRGLAWVGLISGAGYLASGVGALIRGPESAGTQNPLSSIGPLGIFVVYPVWAVWLGIWMMRQARRVTAEPAVVKPGA
jgi:hypothetical protein